MRITSYETLPIGRYQQIIESLQKEEDDIDAHASIIALVNGMTKDEVLSLPLLEYKRMAEDVSFLLEPLPKTRGRIGNRYELGGMVLIPSKDLRKWTAAQFIDYQTMSKEKDRLVEMLSCILIPEGHSYVQGYDIADVQKVIAENMSVMDVAEMSAFFLRKLQSSINHILICLGLRMRMELTKEERKELVEMVKVMRHSVRNGVGFPQWIA